MKCFTNLEMHRQSVGLTSKCMLQCARHPRSSAGLYTQTASLLIPMPHAFCHVDLLKNLGAPGSRKRRRQAAHVLPEDAALHAANVRFFRGK